MTPHPQTRTGREYAIADMRREQAAANELHRCHREGCTANVNDTEPCASCEWPYCKDHREGGECRTCAESAVVNAQVHPIFRGAVNSWAASRLIHRSA